MRLRPARQEDAGAIADIVAAARAAMTYRPRLHTDAETRAWIREMILVGYEVSVAGDDGPALAFAAPEGDSLEHLDVHPGAQGRGLGTLLLTDAKARRPAGLRLWVFQRNERARRFSERHGFVCVRLTAGEENEEHEPDALSAWPASAATRGELQLERGEAELVGPRQAGDRDRQVLDRESG